MKPRVTLAASVSGALLRNARSDQDSPAAEVVHNRRDARKHLRGVGPWDEGRKRSARRLELARLRREDDMDELLGGE